MHFSFQTVIAVQPASSFVRIPQEIYTSKCTLPAKKQYKKAKLKWMIRVGNQKARPFY